MLVDEIHLVVEKEGHSLTELANRDLLLGEAEVGLYNAEMGAVYMVVMLGRVDQQMPIEMLVRMYTYEKTLVPVEHLSYVANEGELLAFVSLMRNNFLSGC